MLASLDLSSHSSDEEQLSPDPALAPRHWRRERRCRYRNYRRRFDLSAIGSAFQAPTFQHTVPSLTTSRAPATTTKADKCAALMLPPAAKKAKPKSETYKQAWSVSEQHLLGDYFLNSRWRKESVRSDCLFLAAAWEYSTCSLTVGGPRYRRLWVAAGLRARSQVVSKSILKN